MDLKKYVLAILVGLGVEIGFAQGLESYIQQLDGTELDIPMVAIPKGTFMLGSPEDEMGRKTDEGPQKRVEVNAFWMSKYEVTWEWYNLFLQRSIDHVPQKNKGQDIDLEVDAVSGATIPYVDMSLGMGTGAGMPVVNVTQLAASKFCEWLSAKTGYFYRLPTEAEWEYAARAGQSAAYFFGEDPEKLEAYAWYDANSNGTYHKVGGKEPNPFGLYDIYGNVAEWTLDQYSADAYQDKKAPFQAIESEYPVVVRGRIL